MKNSNSSFGTALRWVRAARQLPQGAFDRTSSRTYISALERGLKQPTFTKVDSLAVRMRVHPLTILTLSDCESRSAGEAAALLKDISAQIEKFLGVVSPADKLRGSESIASPPRI
jgi:hypothetical protein